MLYTAKAKKPITTRARSGCPSGRVAIVWIAPTVAVVEPPRLIPASVTSTPTTRERAPRVTSPFWGRYGSAGMGQGRSAGGRKGNRQGGPGFWLKGAQGERVVAEESDEDTDAAVPEDAVESFL